jgi:ferredoxin--NADP+ reductase
VCVDGPEFNGHLVDWNGLLSRMQFYRGEEQLSIERWEQLRETPSHECNLDKAPA